MDGAFFAGPRGRSFRQVATCVCRRAQQLLSHVILREIERNNAQGLDEKAERRALASIALVEFTVGAICFFLRFRSVRRTPRLSRWLGVSSRILWSFGA